MSFFQKPISSVSFQDLQDLVYRDKQRESVFLDYKSGSNPAKLSEDISKDVSSFANYYGGYLIYGIDENGKGVPTGICGVGDAEKLKNQIIQICASPENLQPPIFLEDPKILDGNINGKKVSVVVAKIDESPTVPHFYRGTTSFYMRCADTNQPIEGSYDAMKLLENRRAKAEEACVAQMGEARDYSLRWLARLYDPNHHTKDTALINIPSFSVSLQPRLFGRSFIDWRKIPEAIKKSVETLKIKFSWPYYYSYAYFEKGELESYANTFLRKWHNKPPQYKTIYPNASWTSASSTGLLYHFQDMPFQCLGPTPDGGENPKPQFAFNPVHVMCRVMGFLLFMREYYSILEKNVFLDLRIEFYQTQNMLRLHHDNVYDKKHVIESHFLIERSFSTLQMDQSYIEHLIYEITPELLVDVNMPGDSFDVNDYNEIFKVLKGEI